MVKGDFTILIVTLLVVLIVPASYGASKKSNFNPKDPKMSNIKTVNSMLDIYITKKDRENIKSVKAYTQERASKYALLIFIEFNENLSMKKLETMRQGSPERWKVFQTYINKSLAWLSLTKKADDFLGGHLERVLKNDLGES